MIALLDPVESRKKAELSEMDRAELERILATNRESLEVEQRGPLEIDFMTIPEDRSTPQTSNIDQSRSIPALSSDCKPPLIVVSNAKPPFRERSTSIAEQGLSASFHPSSSQVLPDELQSNASLYLSREEKAPETGAHAPPATSRTVPEGVERKLNTSGGLTVGSAVGAVAGAGKRATGLLYGAGSTVARVIGMLHFPLSVGFLTPSTSTRPSKSC